MASIYIEGLDKLRSKLDRIAAIDPRPMLLKAALVVEREAKILCPVDTGLLRNSITSHVGTESAIVGTSVSYGKNVELGINQRPQPFLTTALLSKAKSIQATFSRHFNKKIKEIANG